MSFSLSSFQLMHFIFELALLLLKIFIIGSLIAAIVMPLFPSLLILKYIPHHNEKRHKLRQQEEYIYQEFEDKFREALLQAKDQGPLDNIFKVLIDDTVTTVENNLLEELKFVNKGVRELKRDLKILLDKNRKDIDTALILGGITGLIGILAPQLFLTQPIITSIISALGLTAGSTNALNAVKSIFDRIKETEEWKKKGEVYLAWRICDQNAWLIL